MRIANIKIGIWAIIAMLAMVACQKNDDGVNGIKVEVSAEVVFTDVEYWPSSQEIYIGLYKNNGVTLAYSKAIEKNNGEKQSVVISDVTSGEYICKIFVEEAGIEKSVLHTFDQQNFDQNIELPLANVKLLTFKRVQTQVFNSCIVCHGPNSGQVAANMSLVEGESYNNLVNKSSLHSDKNRVVPFQPDSSFLIDVLYEDNIGFAHSYSSAATNDDKMLVKHWIKNGALKDE